MKAEDLMTGDWILYGGKPVQVLQLSEGKDYKHISPIPITPEILEKNGWALWEIEGEYKGVISIYGREAPFGVFDGIEINFVHQLQHALRLCGIDKTIEL